MSFFGFFLPLSNLEHSDPRNQCMRGGEGRGGGGGMMVIVMGAVLDWQRKKKGIEEQRV